MRSKAIIWNVYASERITEAARQRKRGDYHAARIALQTARHAIEQRNDRSGGPSWGALPKQRGETCSK